MNLRIFPSFSLVLALGCSGADDSPSGEPGGSTGQPMAGQSGGGTPAAGSAGKAGSSASGASGRGGAGGAGANGGDQGGYGAGGSSGSSAGSGDAAGRGGAVSAGGSSAGTSANAGGAGGSVSSAGAASGTGGAAGDSGASGAGGTPPSGGASGAGTECDTSDPPSNVSAWIDESFDDQLGDNLRNRKVWLLDSAIMGEGQINVCVRWGATSAVPAMVAANLAATVERWFNDWFTALGDYDCFPYPEGVSVKITGWAVKPGQQSLLAAVDSSIPVYTETDAEGEPKCPDVCSFFVNPSHEFPRCPGGADNHSDYWLWFDDQLPGGGGAAAVGGDWGLRMPLATFADNFEAESFMIVEHEMGHGFGFQDYYEWSGTRPMGGSLMIVGSTSSQKPSVGDQWLLRRAWSETKALRGW